MVISDVECRDYLSYLITNDTCILCIVNLVLALTFVHFVFVLKSTFFTADQLSPPRDRMPLLGTVLLIKVKRTA